MTEARRFNLFVFICIFWMVIASGSLWAGIQGHVSVLEALGLGTVNGFFLAMIKDAWQFYWRKSPDGK